jgi:integrase
MTLVRRANSKYWYVQFQLKHQTIIRSTRTTDKRTAERVAAKIRAEAHERIVLGRKKQITLGEALERFVQSKAGTPNHRNQVNHAKQILRHIRGSLPLAALQPSMLEDYKQRRLEAGSSRQTIKHSLNCLTGALKKARREGYDCPDLQAPAVKVPNGKLRFLTLDEEKRLLDELDPSRSINSIPTSRRAEIQGFIQDNHDLIILLLDTGARYSEIANIHWKQINLEGRSISLWRSKVSNESIIFMTDRVHEILTRRSLSPSGLHLFTNKAGAARGYSSVAIRKAFRRAGLTDCTIHTLRHTHASRLIQNGLSVYEVRAVLGHTDIKTTMRYAHLEQVSVTQKARDVINRLNSP